MSKIKVQIIDCNTGEEIIREMTPDEIAQYEVDKANSIANKQKKLDQEAAKEALLAKLGITVDEAKLLLS